jgi:hypothetical protein
LCHVLVSDESANIHRWLCSYLTPRWGVTCHPGVMEGASLSHTVGSASAVMTGCNPGAFDGAAVRFTLCAHLQGWLKMDFAREVRLERKLGEGGFGQVRTSQDLYGKLSKLHKGTCGQADKQATWACCHTGQGAGGQVVPIGLSLGCCLGLQLLLHNMPWTAAPVT